MRPPDFFSTSFNDTEVLVQARQILAKCGRVHLPDFLAPERAHSLHKALADVEWRLTLNGERNAFDLTPADVGALDATRQAALLDALHAKAQGGFQYLYDSHRISDLYESGKERSGPLARLYARLNSEPALAAFRALTGDDRIVYLDAQATRYRAGHFLNEHDDDVDGKHRLFAYVINLTPSWRVDWGGLLLFPDADGHVAEAFAPKWNAINILRVPQPHAVSAVAPFVKAARYSITGWMRSQKP